MDDVVEGAAPDSFIDPISQELMRDPVSTCDGLTYERATIEHWLRGHNTSPISNAQLANKNLTPNIGKPLPLFIVCASLPRYVSASQPHHPATALRKAIEEWTAAHFKTIPRSQLTIGAQLAQSSFKTVWQGEVSF